MSPYLYNKLVTKYPSQFSEAGKSPSENNMAFGIECGDGWYAIVAEVCRAVDDSEDKVVWTQIKEKFGGLRMYYFGGSDFVEGVVRMAEHMSYRTCERCGHPGTPNEGGWIMTLCERCRGPNG